MPNAIVMTGYGPPEVLKWTTVPLTEPGAGQVRIKVKAAGISPTDLALRAGYRKAIPLPPNAVLGFRLRAHETMPMQQAADAHRQLESGDVHQRIILTLN